MPHRQLVGREQVALAYIEALERWEMPGKAVREQFGLSVKFWEKLRAELTRDGWLPATQPPWRGPFYRIEANRYAAEARKVLARKLAAQMEQIRAREAQDAAKAARVEARRVNAERTASRKRYSADRREEIRAAQVREQPSAVVLDAFL